MWAQIEQLLEPVKQRFNQFWQPLAQREKMMLASMAIFLIWVLLYAIFWLPMQNAQQQAQQQYVAAQNQWQWLNQQIPAWQKQDGKQLASQVTDRNQLMSKVQATLRQMNLHKQIGKIDLTNKGVKVVFKEVASARLFQWLATLEQQGVVSDKVQISPISDDGKKGYSSAQIDFVVD
ncbi:general secretion pathway protein M [uncultured Thiomicrorhabdus sp.]